MDIKIINRNYYAGKNFNIGFRLAIHTIDRT